MAPAAHFDSSRFPHRLSSQHGSTAYLVNTGWTGGAHGVGERMSIRGTRACIDAILDGTIHDAEFSEARAGQILSVPSLPHSQRSAPLCSQGVEARRWTRHGAERHTR